MKFILTFTVEQEGKDIKDALLAFENKTYEAGSTANFVQHTFTLTSIVPAPSKP